MRIHLLQGISEKSRRIRNTARWRISLLLAYLWRRMMFRTTVIAITGSVGKTTAKECLAVVLASHGHTLKTFQNQNDRSGVARTIRAMRPWHRFAVVEVGTGGPGEIRRLARLISPDIAIVLSVARTHTNAFRTLENTAMEKAELLKFLPRRGLAILNADDPRVRLMADGCGARTRFFGQSPECDYQAESVESRWPERLQFQLRTNSGDVHVGTQLVGTHWLGSVLCALAASDACSIPVLEAARQIGEVPPFMGRMEPVALPSGAVVMRDEENGSPDTLDAMFKVLRESKAYRRGLVFSDISDSGVRPRERLRKIGRAAAELCDFAVFVGSHGHRAVKSAVAVGMDPASVHAFVDLQDAAEWLKRLLRPGDLVFMKGRTTDHLSRILFAQFGTIGCWKTQCNIRRLCDVCNQVKPDFDLKVALEAPIIIDHLLTPGTD